ncbi:AAA family ATPase [Kitasatospora sp. NPDC088134]|uniref:AAA family ATPase n=1 Tax=Kitasatospora sp. NPDC088134 TaxID=3364071 RepID=UPI003819DFD1
MSSELSGLRAWLTSLDDSLLSEVLSLPTSLPYAAGIRVEARGRWRARELRSARAYLHRATLAELRALSRQGTSFATHLLVHHHGLAADALEDVTGELAQRMLSDLPPVPARFLYYYLVIEEPGLPDQLGITGEELLALADRPGSPEPHSCGDNDGTGGHLPGQVAGEELHERVIVPVLPTGEGVLGDELAALRQTAIGLAGNLRAAADLADAGSPLPAGLGEEITDFNALRSALAERLAEAAGQVPSATESWAFDDFDRVRELVLESEREAQRRQAQAEELRGRVAKYEALMQEEDDQDALAVLAMVRDKYLEQLASIETAGASPVEESEPAAAAGKAAARQPAVESAAAAADGPPEEPEQASPQNMPVQDSAPPVPEAADEPDVAPVPEPHPSPESVQGPAASTRPADEPDQRDTDTAVDAEPGDGTDSTTDSLPEGEGEGERAGECERPAIMTWSTTEDGPGPVADLVRQGRLAEAYWLTKGSGESELRAETLAFVEAAFSCTTEAAGTRVLSAFNRNAKEDFRDDRSAQIAAIVASLRAGFVAGWPNDLLNQFDPAAALPEQWAAFVEAAVHTVRHCQRINPATGGLDHPAPGVTREQIGGQARELLTDLPRRRTSYERATQVLARLAAPGQPLGSALQTVVDWAAGTATAADLDTAASFLADPDQLIDGADTLVRNPKQAKETIEAKARRSLLRAIGSVSDLLDQARSIAASQADTRPDVSAVLRAALSAAAQAPALPGVDGALLDLLCQWLRGDAVAANRASARAEDFPDDLCDYRPDDRPLLVLPGLPRHPDGAPAPEDDGFAPTVLDLLAPTDASDAVLAHCDRGDIHLAEALTAAVEQGAVPSARDNGTGADRTEAIDRARAKWSTRLRAEHAAASGLLAEVRIQRTLDPVVERELAGELERLEEPRPGGAYGPAVRQIDALTQQMRTAVQVYAVRLRSEFAALDLDPRTRAAVDKLLDMHDTATAEEYLSLIKRGESLPDWGSTDWGADLTAFSDGIDLAADEGRLQQGHSARPWARHYAGGNDLTAEVEPALEAWDALCDASVRNQEWQRHLPRMLRLLGLEADQATLKLDNRSVGQIRATLRATASESRPGYVAPLGSDARGRYNVLIVADKQVGRSVLDLLDESDSSATLVLYLHPMGLTGRRQLAARARSGMRQALVVDPAVVGWIAARYPRSFRATQRVTLPWTAFNTYTPFVAGLVPTEVFYGRRDEMSQVIDPRGGLFLYGGRQLGKSALLRRVENTYATEHRSVVFLDLKARGIGEAEPAERIWADLAAELHRRGVLGKPKTTDTPDTVVERIEAWLAADEERSLLVLLDEADAFLNADSRSVHSRGGEATFPNVLRFKRLMDDEQRRFKVVFAGLHQVQRFGHLSNVPLKHGGPDILVGPLNPSEAQRLVVEPMAALGFVFERPELAWRVLAATNFQASLVQLFCYQLVSALRAAPTTDATWPIVVTEADMRSVSASPLVRTQIADRMRITINLEDRYRLLTLIIALRSQKDGYRGSYGADELLQEARRRWPEGFRELNADQVLIYLEEMVGLGLLVIVSRPGDQLAFAVRSPNVVNMLGTPEDLERELAQTEFRLPYEYNPRYSRRMVGLGGGGIQQYSPLTEEQLSSVTGPGTAAVCVTSAFRPKLLMTAVETYAAARDLTVVRTSGPDLPGHIDRGADHLLLVDLRGAADSDLDNALALLHATAPGTQGPAGGERRAVLLVDPAGVRGRSGVLGNAIRLERWSADSLRAWPECPFDTPQQRQAVIEATGGWPVLVEMVVHQITRTGAGLESVLEKIRAMTATPEYGRTHLEHVGLDTGMAQLLTQWTQLLDEPEPDTPARIADIIGVPEDEILDVVSRLVDLGVIDQGDHGIALDPVTFRALAAVTAGA